jgi:cellulose synthase/poly-beta-1,6-N-acetylglucosamine synthase-like glycosyltransferase/peptidoglycan/xylan/chitin deacetylase (PgdA/CDA1 family)/spore germination protein YaaH
MNVSIHDKPVFYDASGRRRARFRFGVLAFLLLLILSIGTFVTTIVAVLPQARLPFDVEHPSLRAAKGREPFHPAIKRASHWLLPARTDHSRPLRVAFHAPWDDASTASLARHVDDIDWLVPGWISITGPEHKFTLFPDTKGRAIIEGAARRPKLLPMVQNAIDGAWDGPGIAAMLRDPVARGHALDRIGTMLTSVNADGVFFDFEDLPATSQRDYLTFLKEARTRFAPHGWLITLAVPVDNPEWDLKAYAKSADRLFLMAYDEHYQGGEAGPIASLPWFMRKIAEASRGIDPGKLIVAVGNYAYDWTDHGQTDADSVEEAWLKARESGAEPVFDPASGNSHFAYEEGPAHHEVWLMDAVTAHGQLTVLQKAGYHQIALWRLGTEDPSFWQLFGRHRPLPASASALEQIPAGTDVDIEGNGEILQIGSVPIPGLRRISQRPDGTITNVDFLRLPSLYTIERTGYKPGLVALTFDDGPDPVWTPKILDVLKREHVPATFFIIGDNALANRGLLSRLINEGHEVGNHTYTHPNLGMATERETELEVNATQRLFQAFTGRSLRLFRAPYFGDAEPTTADEIVPAYTAQQLGYLSVGLHVDPGDWKRPGTDAIVDRTVQQVEASNEDRSGQIVLLHDAGGDRAQTVEALPRIIDTLRAKGYHFVTVSTLAGLTREQVMPPISRSDRLAATADLALFTALGFTIDALGWLFGAAIAIGIGRAVLLSGLALLQARREGRTIFPAIDPDRFVSVLIPAFNEVRVIEQSIRRVLASRDVRLEVIVIDDGSTDGTSDVVRAHFADEPRVALLTLENGGKARALNQGLLRTKGEIVIALDADTQFEPQTIARLARWFVDPKIGGVAGNAKVGNRVNLVTRWQALEYVTAQNLERRALARLGAMTVVPGAVGAWRLSALREMGGYPPDTLAEDQDLTIAIQRAGWKVHYDQYAVAWTEAPESFAALAKQRFRWAYGTLQCLWKHRTILRTGYPRGLAWVGLPQAMLFQILFAMISPVIDLALIISIADTWMQVQQHGWAQTEPTLWKMLDYWLIFSAIDLLAGIIAFALERREQWRLLWLLLPQRILYRQIMYYGVIKAVGQALQGLWIGWGKLERSGRVATSQ